jgi:hypothetical protein
MTTCRATLPLWMLLAAIGGCASDAAGAPDDDDPSESCEPIGGSSIPPGAPLDGISYQVTGGFTGTGDGTSLEIAPDGAVTRTTREGGTERGQLGAATLDRLTRAARAAQLPTLCKEYPCPGCGDDYIHDVSVRFEGNTYRVRASTMAPPLPDRLQAVIDAVQDIVEQPLL